MLFRSSKYLFNFASSHFFFSISFGLPSENFPHTDQLADNLVGKVRTQRALEMRINTEWELDDFLVALKARMGPIQRIGCDMMNVAIRLCHILWPKDSAPRTTRSLAEKMMDAEDRLTEWRQSAARAGADEALS